jgi:hypothetical protein
MKAQSDNELWKYARSLIFASLLASCSTVNNEEISLAMVPQELPALSPGAAIQSLGASDREQLRPGEEAVRIWQWRTPWDLSGAAMMYRSERDQTHGPMVRLILDRQGRVWAEFWSWIRPERPFPHLEFDIEFRDKPNVPPLTSTAFSTSIDNRCDNGDWPFATLDGPAGRHLLDQKNNPDLWKLLEYARPLPDSSKYKTGGCVGGRP